MRQQHLQPFACNGSSPLPAKQCQHVAEVHARQTHATALRPNNRPIRLLRCIGTAISNFSPRNRRAASKYALAAALVGLLSVTGAPRLEAFSTSTLSGTMPRSGIDRIS